MKKEFFTKDEMLRHFSNVKYSTTQNFLSEASKMGLIKYNRGFGYVFLKERITAQDKENLETRMRELNYKYVKKTHKNDISLDEMAKIIAKSGQYKIENGKVYKLTSIWKEL